MHRQHVHTCSTVLQAVRQQFPPLSCVQLFLHQQAFLAYLGEESLAVGSMDAVMPSTAPADPHWVGTLPHEVHEHA